MVNWQKKFIGFNDTFRYFKWFSGYLREIDVKFETSALLYPSINIKKSEKRKCRCNTNYVIYERRRPFLPLYMKCRVFKWIIEITVTSLMHFLLKWNLSWNKSRQNNMSNIINFGFPLPINASMNCTLQPQ